MKTPENFVVVHGDDVDVNTLGHLQLYMRWRAGRRQAGVSGLQQWQEGLYRVPIDTIGVVPRSVLYWDALSGGELRLNSLKRFAYMLGLRAVPLAIAGGSAALKDYLEDIPQTDQLGYPESRQQAETMLTDWFDSDATDRPGHLHRTNTRLTFGYFPPDNKSVLMSVHDYLSESMPRVEER